MRLRSLLLLTIVAVAAAQPGFQMWPGAPYDPAIPTTQKVLGFAPGERVAYPAEIVQYFEALAAAVPSRIKIFDYARTWEKRRLIYAAIGSEANLKRLDQIKADIQRLADPRKTSAAEAQKLTAGLPAVVMLSNGVHGNEISGPDAAMMTAYHLLAARNDAMVSQILRDALVLIDPAENPDGRNRFVHNFTVAEGLAPDGSTVSAERNEPWPGGRTNHYHFDMNRDWFALTQPETRGRIKVMREWWPLIFIDLHEMGTDSTYFFSPGAEPFNPHLQKYQLESQAQLGENNAKYFDQFGYPYFTREVYDEFYPGYGASWPWFYGGIAATYENASVRGLLAQRSDGTLYRYQDSVRKHFIASLATCESAAKMRQRLLDNFYKFRSSAIEEGKTEPIREYILPRTGNTSSVDKLAVNLAEQGVELKRATAAFTANGKQYPAGSYVVPLAQPAKRLIRNLLDPKTDMDAKFIAEQERRRKRKLRDEIYDVTAWSLPLMYNVECIPTGTETAGAFEAFKGPAPKGTVTGGKATVAYVVPWGANASGRFLTNALREGLTIHSADKAFTQNGRKFGPGAVIVQVKQNGPGVHDAVAKLAEESGAEVLAVNTSWVESGINFGSNNVFPIARPQIALAWDTPVQGGSAGHTRFVLERQYGFPVTAVRTRQLATADLTKFHVLLLPDPQGNYAAEIGPVGMQRIKDWAQAGGTIVALGAGATAFLASNGLLGVQQENIARPETPAPKPEAPKPATNEIRTAGKLITKQEEYEKAIQADTELPDDIAGVLVKVKVDQEHWLTAGVPETVYAVLSGRSIFAPIKTDKGVNVAIFAGPDELLSSGYLWEENRKQLAFKPLVVTGRHGRGVVVAFTADPDYRAYVDGLNILVLNAVFRGPAHARGGFRE
ncbi:MAG: M14 family zinc carboxypeptidase [Bryobacteraceae bacterium]